MLPGFEARPHRIEDFLGKPVLVFTDKLLFCQDTSSGGSLMSTDEESTLGNSSGTLSQTQESRVALYGHQQVVEGIISHVYAV